MFLIQIVILLGLAILNLTIRRFRFKDLFLKISKLGVILVIIDILLYFTNPFILYNIENVGFHFLNFMSLFLDVLIIYFIGFFLGNLFAKKP